MLTCTNNHSVNVTPSFEKRGVAVFLRDRAVRLLPPIIVYELLLQPVNYGLGAVAHDSLQHFIARYVDYWTRGTEIGYRFPRNPMWFILNLFIFDIIYSVSRLAFRGSIGSKISVVFGKRVDTNEEEYGLGRICLVSVIGIILLGTVSFIVRISFVVGYWETIVGQAAYYPHYALAYALGTLAYAKNAIQRLPSRLRYSLLPASLLLLAALLLLKFDQPTKVAGRLNGLAFAFALCEAAFGLLFNVTVILLSRDFIAKEPGSRFEGAFLSSNYAIYILHPSILVPLVLAVRPWAVSPWIKLVIVAPATFVLTSFVGSAVRMVPGVSKVL